MDGEGTLLRVEVILSRGNLSVAVGYDFGEHVSLVLELTVLENGDVRIVSGTFIYRSERHSGHSIILFTEAKVSNLSISISIHSPLVTRIISALYHMFLDIS